MKILSRIIILFVAIIIVILDVLSCAESENEHYRPVTAPGSHENGNNNQNKPEECKDPESINTEKLPDEKCAELLKNKIKTEFNFIPASTIAGLLFVGVWFAFILIAKIMYSSTDQYKLNNRFDLVIFKPATKNSLIGPRRIYSNNNVNIQNMNAATASGMDLSFLYQRNTAFNQQSLYNSNSEVSLNTIQQPMSYNKANI
jgi:hypothetical protein